MEKHDKIYVPCDENDSALFAAWGEEAADYVGAIREKENVIVLSPEELKELWEKAVQEGYEKRMNGFTAWLTGFNEYLKSKGITL